MVNRKSLFGALLAALLVFAPHSALAAPLPSSPAGTGAAQSISGVTNSCIATLDPGGGIVVSGSYLGQPCTLTSAYTFSGAQLFSAAGTAVTITNGATIGTLTLTNPLAIAQGGTGGTTAAGGATAPITVSGTFPNQTYACATCVTTAGGQSIAGTTTFSSSTTPMQFSADSNGNVLVTANPSGSLSATVATLALTSADVTTCGAGQPSFLMFSVVAGGTGFAVTCAGKVLAQAGLQVSNGTLVVNGNNDANVGGNVTFSSAAAGRGGVYTGTATKNATSFGEGVLDLWGTGAIAADTTCALALPAAGTTIAMTNGFSCLATTNAANTASAFIFTFPIAYATSQPDLFVQPGTVDAVGSAMLFPIITAESLTGFTVTWVNNAGTATALGNSKTFYLHVSGGK